MDWRVKAALQRLLSRVPASARLNALFQMHLGGLRDVEGAVDQRLSEDWLVLVARLAELQLTREGLVYVEVGTGWLPVLPLCFSLAGAKAVHSYDVTRLLRPDLSFKTVRGLRAHFATIAEAAGRPLGEVTSRYASLAEASTQEELFRLARIQYHAPADASLLALEDGSVDVVFSNNVLEHIPPATLRSIMAESRRLLTPSGVTIHAVNCGDHYADFDRSITPINYLRYSERAWRRWNNPLQYQNRLRPQDFAELVREAGLELVLYEHSPSFDLMEALPSIGIAPEFREYPPEQLCSTSVTVAGRLTADAPAPLSADTG